MPCPKTPGARQLGRVRGKIEFQDVGFAYEKEHPILRGISLTIEPGQTVALVGGTGAGKTTVLSLVPRFYDPDAGRVLLDGGDVRESTKKSLRTNISVVLQDTLLLSGTVLENIAYGRPGASKEEIRAAARGRPGRCVHRAAAARLRNAGGRARRATERGPEAAHRPGPRVSQGRADPAPR